RRVRDRHHGECRGDCAYRPIQPRITGMETYMDKAGTARIAIYARQSVKQDEGIDRQIEMCKAAIAGRGDMEVVAVYADNATSASRARGEGTQWAEMLAAFDRGEFDGVFVV